MPCSNCQTDVPADAVFCPKCGQRVGVASAPHAGNPVPGSQPTGRNAPAEPERELWSGGYSPKAMLGWWLLDGLATVAGIIACILFPIPPVWIGVALAVATLSLYLCCYYLTQRLGVSYTLSTLKLTHKTGLLRQVTNRIDIIDIDDVTYEQGLLERLLGIGTIIVSSSDTSHPKLAIRQIDDVQRVAGLIDNASGDERRRRGAFVESV